MGGPRAKRRGRTGVVQQVRRDLHLSSANPTPCRGDPGDTETQVAISKNYEPFRSSEVYCGRERNHSRLHRAQQGGSGENSCCRLWLVAPHSNCPLLSLCSPPNCPVCPHHHGQPHCPKGPVKMALEWEDTSHPAPDLKVIGRVLGRGYGGHIASGEQAGTWHQLQISEAWVFFLSPSGSTG